MTFDTEKELKIPNSEEDSILDSISYIEQSTPLSNKISGKYYQIKINETGELIDVYENNNEIALYLADKNKEVPYSRFERYLGSAIGKVEINGKELKTLAVNEKYQNYKLGDFLVKKAVEEYGCEYVVCNGTRAYKLYRKYGFVPINSNVFYKTESELKKEGPRSIITLVQKDKLGSKTSKYEDWFVEYYDKNYKGQLDSAPKKIKNINVGDTIEFKDGRVGIVEDYDNKYFYIKDNNTNIIKIKKN